MSVPKPSAQRRRRNVLPAAKADRRLPTAGRAGLPPTPPVPLSSVAKRWWDWAWSTPQATTWNHDGFTEPLIKRAQLEDMWENTLVGNTLVDPCKVLTLMMRLDDSFGFTPRSAAALHMSFTEPEPDGEVTDRPVTDIRNRLKGLA